MHSKKEYVFIFDSIPYFKDRIHDRGYKIFNTYRKLGYLFRFLRKLSFLLGFKKSIWFDLWKKEICDDRVFIVFATNTVDHIRFIRERNKNCRIILWYWNPVFRCVLPNIVEDLNVEVWSFDETDCEKYNLKRNTTFYFKEISLKNRNIEHDLFFLGLNKGRKSMLKSLEENFKSQNIKCFFYIVEDKKSERKLPLVSYSKYLEYLSSSSGILDILQEGQSGMTLRVMECLFFDLKLVINSFSLDKEISKLESIMIMENDSFDVENVRLFLDRKSNIEKNTSLKEYYDFDSWLKRFEI